MQQKCNNLLQQLEKTTPKCKTSLDCDFNFKKQLTNTSKQNFILHTSSTFQSPDDLSVGQENRAPCEMSSCDSGELLAADMVVTNESDDSASDTGAVNNIWSTKQNKILSCRHNKRKQSRPQRCSSYLRDRNNSLDSAIDLGDIGKDSDEDDFQPNGCHAVDDTNENEMKTEENGNDHKFVVTNQTGLPCIFRIQPNEDHKKMHQAAHSEADIDSYILTATDYENGALSGGSEPDSFVEHDMNMENVIRIEPQDPESGAASGQSPLIQGEEIEPGEVIGNRAAEAKNVSYSSQPNQSIENATLNLSMKKSMQSANANVGRAPLRHRRTIGELYGLVNPQKRGRGGATNHIAMKYRRDCPIPGCGARYLTNLCDHLKKTHGLGPEERRPWLEKAKRLHQQKQLQEQQQMQQQSTKPPTNPHLASSISSSTNPTANLAASNLAAIALATSQSTAKMSSTDSIAMAMSQIPINRAALLMQQAQALSLLNARAFPNPTPFPGFPTTQQRLTQPFPSFSPLTGARIRSPWNNSGSRKNCPVPGCGAKSLLNLSDHLSKVHSMTRDERQPWLQRARDETP